MLEGTGLRVTGLLETTMKVSEGNKLIALGFSSNEQQKEFASSRLTPMKRQSKWGQNKLRPRAAGQRQGGGGGRRAALPGRSGLAAALRRHFISVTCTGA